MQGDFSRSTFEARRGYRSVLLQQGRVLLDSEVNEQAAITAHHDETRTVDVVGPAGGPLPLDGGPGPFAVVDASGATPTGPVPWAQLLVTPGRYYADGVLAESPAPTTGPGWRLTDQPHLPGGLPEPGSDVAVGGRVGLFLDVWQHHVTPDEDLTLLEPALGGPDTSTRSQTVWQVRWLPLVDKGDGCADIVRLSGATATHRTMAARLEEPVDSDDPCRITTSGGYQLLENQLYRVQVHTVAADGSATFLWSRENGSVVAGIRSFGASTGGTTELVLDRDGRDEELSFHDQSLVEVTSEDRVLRGEPGFLATAGAPLVSGTSAEGLTLPVTWAILPGPTFAQLGAHPVARRWEGGPLPVRTTKTLLEGGISVTFGAAGAPLRTGDYWQVPARTVRLAYGLTARTGTIEWPTDGSGTALMVPPAGVPHHVAPLATLLRDAAGWVVQSDCRSLFPPLTSLVTIDLVGGDGQEAMPGDPLPEPVRVVVRNGGVPVVGARVKGIARSGATEAGAVDDAEPIDVAASAIVTAVTGSDGVASFFWRLDPAGSTTQTLTLTRLDAAQPTVDVPVDVEVVATARLSVARQVAWDDPRCAGFAEVRTVADALAQLSTTRSLLLLGGDGQEVDTQGDVLARPVRVAVTSPCGPVEGAKVTAGTAGGADGAVAVATGGGPAPATLGGDTEATAVTGGDGIAEFWWQPQFADGRSALLDVRLEESDEPHAHVTSTLDLGRGTRGLHITDLLLSGRRQFRNDSRISGSVLARGFEIVLDGPVNPRSVAGKPVVHLTLALPWPWPGDGDVWSQTPVGTRTVELAGSLDPKENLLIWRPSDHTAEWLTAELWDVLLRAGWDNPVEGRLVVDSWAIQAAGDERGVPINGHAVAVMDGNRTELVLPTDDAIAGGRYEQWFWLMQKAPDERVLLPEVVGLGRVAWRKALADVGVDLDTLDLETQVVAGVPKGRILSMDPPPGTPLEAGTRVRVVVSG
ncbi:DUF6519 domain-containing protein [Cellulomonas sp. ICMP 17802]|uniref:DUF6519 domain-containing protein n=1 Tax=Cellulomonas sp. ICMP 17802 TaxID=3239199 RepID=UPI00351B5FBE